MPTHNGPMLQPLKPGERVPLGFDEWLISDAEAEHIKAQRWRATLNGEPVPVFFIASWEHVNATQVKVPGSMS